MANAEPSVVVILPGVPVPKGRPRFDPRTSRAYTPEATRSFEQMLAWAARAAMRGRAPLQGALEVTVWVRLPVPESASKTFREKALLGLELPAKRPDADNFGKTIDALNGVAWKDDGQAVDLLIRKRYSADPALVIEIREMS